MSPCSSASPSSSSSSSSPSSSQNKSNHNASPLPPSFPYLNFNFDIDHYLNRFLPRPRLHLLPRSISHFLGYRASPERSLPLPLIWLHAFIGAFVSLSLIALTYRSLPPIYHPNTKDEIEIPIIIASFGATAILEFHSIASPLSQPRNLVLGQLFSAAIGTGLTKAFQASLSPSTFQSLRWLVGALAVGLSSMVMGATKTVHPPAGATALLAATSDEVGALGWWLLGLIGIGSAVVVGWGCLWNNVGRCWPLWWWTELELGVKSEDDKAIEDMEKGVGRGERKGSEIEGDSDGGRTRHVEFATASSGKGREVDRGAEEIVANANGLRFPRIWR